MITTFKIFNTKTKESKEYNKPDFGDFGNFIQLRLNNKEHKIDVFYQNTDHELNTLHNGLFKDCIYVNGDWVGVLFYCFRYDHQVPSCWNLLPSNRSIVIKSGDWLNYSHCKFLFTYEHSSFKMYKEQTKKNYCS